MAITYVGGQTSGRAGAASTTTVTYALTGGSNATPQAGDLVVLTLAVGTQARNPAQAVTAPATFTSLGQLNPNTTTYDTCLNVSYKFMGGTPDTNFTAPSTGNAADAQRWTVQVFRGVDPTTPLDVAAVSAIGTATGRPNPGSITPTTSGAYVLICGAGAAATGAAYTAPANYTTNFLTGTTVDTNDVMIGSGYRAWTSGAEDPAAYTGGTANAVDSWAVYTIALRPAATGPVTHTATGALVGSGSTVAGSAERVGLRPIRISTTLWRQDTLGTSGTPGAKAITVPADAQGVVVHFHSGQGGTSQTLSISSDFAGTFTIANSTTQNGCSLGYAVVSSTGAKNLTLSWTQTALEGPEVYISFIKNINTSDWVREVAVVGNDTNGTSASNVFDTSTDDLLLVVNDQDGGTAPTTISGFTSLATTDGTYSLPSRLQSCDAPGATTTTVTGTTTNFDVLSGISIKPVTAGPTTHVATGAIVGSGSTLAGTALHNVPHSSTGSLVGAGAVVTGAAARTRVHTATGSLVGSGSTIAGTARHNVPHTSTGALVGSGSTVTGAASRNITTVSHDATGTLVGPGSTLSGAAARTRQHAATGALVGQGSTVTGSGTRYRAHTSSGALTGSGSSVSGAANRFRSHSATGALVGQGSTVAGTARHNIPHASTGTLVGQGANLAGSASRTRVHAATGSLVGSGSTVTGSAYRATPGVPVWPLPSQVFAGVVYGPTGIEYVGTLVAGNSGIQYDIVTGQLVMPLANPILMTL